MISVLSGDGEDNLDSLDQGKSRGQPSPYLAWWLVPSIRRQGGRCYVVPRAFPPLGFRARAAAVGHPAPRRAVRLQARASLLPGAFCTAGPTWWVSPARVRLVCGPAPAPFPCELLVFKACPPRSAFSPLCLGPQRKGGPSVLLAWLPPDSGLSPILCLDHCGSLANSLPFMVVLGVALLT